MKFVKEYVPDKRWANGQRPIHVLGNPVMWLMWKITLNLEGFFHQIKLLIERSFKVVEEHKEDDHA